MADDLFGGLSGALDGLMGGLAKSGLVPKDTPEGELMAAQGELSDLRRQESELLVEIGRQAYEQNPSVWPQDAKLQLIHQNMAAAEAQMQQAQQAQEQARAEQAAAEAVGACPNCGYRNPENIKFCQECGTKLGDSFCTSCGAKLSAGVAFCGECGTRQGEG